MAVPRRMAASSEAAFESAAAVAAARAQRMQRDASLRRWLATADVARAVRVAHVALIIGARAGLGHRLLWGLAAVPPLIVIFKLYGLYDRDVKRISHSTVDGNTWRWPVVAAAGFCTYLAQSYAAARPGSSRHGSTPRRSARASATRRRTPGGSSIWPYTRAAFSMTPDSCISIQRSVPSRVRSPTPANTDTPPCCWATRLIISWMRIVLPTPAPPKRPILPPCTYGSRRSMTLMPVSNICALGSSSSNGGASRWMSQRSSMPSVTSPLDVERLADHVPHVAERAVAHRHLDAVAGVAHDRAALQTVGRLQADDAHPAFTDLLRDLGRDGDRLALELDVHLERLVDLGQRVGRELGVDDRAVDRDDPTVLELLSLAVPALRWQSFCVLLAMQWFSDRCGWR